MDHDRTAYTKTSVFEAIDAYTLGKQEGLPQEQAFSLTQKDLESFPFINDAEPTNYPLSPKALEYDIFSKAFAAAEHHPQVKYRALKFFIKASLLYRNLIEQRANLHIRSARKRKEFVNFHYQRFTKITALLPTLSDINTFISTNPQLLTSIISELEAYNNHFKLPDAHLRVNIQRVRKSFYKNYAKYLPSAQTINNEKREMLQSIIDISRRVIDIQSKLFGLDNQMNEFTINNPGKSILTERLDLVRACRNKLSNYYRRIQSWPEKDCTPPCVLAQELQEINLAFERIHIDLHNLPIINKSLRIYRQIELIKRYYDLCEHKELREAKKRLNACFIAIEEIMTFLNNQHIKNTEKLPDHISIKLKNIENELIGATLLLQRSRYNTDNFVKKTKDNPLDITVRGINKFNALTGSKLHQQYPGTFFAKIKEKSYARNVIENYESKIKQLTQQLTSASQNYSDEMKLARWQLRILKHIRAYYKSLGNNISSRRINDLDDFFQMITTSQNVAQLRSNVQERVKRIEVGWLFRSKLRYRVNQSLHISSLRRQS